MRLVRITKILKGTLLSLLMAGISSMATAADKNFTVTAPDGVAIQVQETGNPEGTAIVFIHGLLGSHLSWEKQVSSPALQRYRLITYDLRGHGLSGKPESPAAYRDGRHYADDLSAVLKATGVRKPVLVGWSLGGVVISNYLAAYGDAGIGGVAYVDGVVELSAAVTTPHPDVYVGMVSPDLKIHLDAERAFLALCFHTQPDTVTFERLLSNAAMASWTMVGATAAMSAPAAEALGKTHVPILALYGAQDALVKTAPSIARLQQLNANVQSKVYENSGHAPFLEEAPRFNHDLAGFVDAVVKPNSGHH